MWALLPATPPNSHVLLYFSLHYRLHPIHVVVIVTTFFLSLYHRPCYMPRKRKKEETSTKEGGNVRLQQQQ